MNPLIDEKLQEIDRCVATFSLGRTVELFQNV